MQAFPRPVGQTVELVQFINLLEPAGFALPVDKSLVDDSTEPTPSEPRPE
jgi:hypothetical protein